MSEQSLTDSKKYKIVFWGEIKAGHDLPSVKSRLAAAFGLNGENINKLFPGKPVLIKGNLTLNDAELFKINFEKSGALCQLLEASIPPVPPVQTITPKPKPVNHVPPVTPDISAVKNNNFTFKPMQKKNNSSKFIGWFAFLVVLALLYNLGKNNQTNTPTTETAPLTQPQKPIKKLPKLPEQAPEANTPTNNETDTGSLAKLETTIFDDPKQFYSITLPVGYSLANLSEGERSKITFSYAGDNTVTILASPMRKSWVPEAEMEKKVSAINSGQAGPFTGFVLERNLLVNFNTMDGYELLMRKGTQIAHAFALVSNNQIAFSVALITTGNDSQANHDYLEKLVRETLKPN